MRKRIPLLVAVAIVLIVATATGLTTFLFTKQSYDRADAAYRAEHAYLDYLNTLDELRKQSYYGSDTDATALKNHIGAAYLAALGDPYAFCLTPEETAYYRGLSTPGAAGIGITCFHDPATGNARISNLLPETPAAVSNLRPGDLILAVDGVPRADYAARMALYGEAGTTVTLTVLRGAERFDVTLTRAGIAADSVYATRRGTVGILTLTAFDDATAETVKTTVTAWKADGVTALVLDLRNHPGGSLAAACAILDYLLPAGDLAVKTVRDGTETVLYTSDAASAALPLAVLVNEGTSDTAELFAETVQQFAARGDVTATVVGTATRGKRTMQSAYLLPDASGAVLTTGLLHASGVQATETTPVSPDREVSLPAAAQGKSNFALSPTEDTQLTAALLALGISE